MIIERDEEENEIEHATPEDNNTPAAVPTQKMRSIYEERKEPFKQYLLKENLEWVDYNNLILSLLDVIEESATDTEETPNSIDGGIVRHAGSLLLGCFYSKPELLDTLFNYPKLDSFLYAVTLRTSVPLIRDVMTNGILHLCKLAAQNGKNVVVHFLPRLVEFLPSIKPNAQNCAEYFHTIIQLYSQNNERIDTANLLNTLVDLIYKHPIIESDAPTQHDYVLIGMLELLGVIFKTDKSLIERVEKTLIAEIFFSCLFELPTPQKQGRNAPPKCKTKESRRAAFNLLSILARDDKNNQEILKLVESNHLVPTAKSIKWNYSPSSDQLSPVGYVGLKNLGCICYMNSLLQQLFMMPTFRRGILSLDEPEDTEDNAKADNLLFQLQVMFSYLQESQKQFFNPLDFCKANKDYDGKPTDVSVQMDADEFFNMLCEKVESSLKGTKQEKLLNNIWACDVVNQVICKECNYISERSEVSYTVSLDIKNKNNIQEALELYVQGEMLEGDNAYMCTKCDKKVDALMRRCIKTLPSTVIIHLKRFEFNFDTMRKVKLNDHCEFPLELSMEPYTKDGLARIENELAVKEGKEIPNQSIDEHPPEYYKYKLAGILIHRGVSDSGHYYSFIKQRGAGNNQWLEFNDEIVQLFDPDNIASECFGGSENLSSVLQESMRSMSSMSQITRSRNAYMLIYERDEEVSYQVLDEDLNNNNNNINNNNEDKSAITRKIKSKKSNENFEVVMSAKLYEEVWKENVNFLMGKKVFDHEYFSFIYQALLEDRTPSDLDYVQKDPAEFYTLKVVANFVLEILTHSKDKEYLPKVCTLLKQKFSQNIPASIWFLESFSKTHTKQLLLECTVKDVRVEICQLLSHVFQELSKFHQGEFFEEMIGAEEYEKKASILQKSIDRLLIYWKYLPLFWKNFSQYFQVLRDFARANSAVRKYLIDKQIPQHIAKLVQDANTKPEDLKNKAMRMGDRFESPNLSNAVALLSILIRGSAIDFPTRADSTEAEDANQITSPEETSAVVVNKFKIEPEVNIPSDVLLILRSETILGYAVADKNNSRSIAQIISYWSFDNKENTMWACDFLIKGINRSEHDGLSPWFAVLQSYLTDLADSLVPIRQHKIFESIMVIFEKFKKYPKYTQSLITNLVDLYRECPVAKEWFDSNRQKTHILEKWMEAKFPSFPGFTTQKWGMGMGSGMGSGMSRDTGHLSSMSSRYASHFNNTRREY